MTLQEEEMPAQLWPAIRQRLAEEPAEAVQPARRPGRRRLWITIGTVTTLLVLAVAGRVWFASPAPVVVQEMVDSQIRARLMVVPYTQLPADPELIRTWFRDKVEFAVLVPTLPQERYTFLGVRLNYFLNRRVAELAYTSGSHPLSFFMLSDADLQLTSSHTVRVGQRTFHVQQYKGYTTILWKDGDIVCGLVSDLQAMVLLPIVRQATAATPAS
jgi:anti-sigma factor RsiW